MGKEIGGRRGAVALRLPLFFLVVADGGLGGAFFGDGGLGEGWGFFGEGKGGGEGVGGIVVAGVGELFELIEEVLR